MIVVDTNLIVYLLLEGEYSSAADHIFLKDPEWCAPFLWRSEFRNVLALYMRQGTLTIDASQKIMQTAEMLMNSNEYNIPSIQILNLVSGTPCTAYDGEFVTLARDLKVPLVTNDRKVRTVFPDIAVSFKDFLNESMKK